jgi:hypothetical protein
MATLPTTAPRRGFTVAFVAGFNALPPAWAARASVTVLLLASAEAQGAKLVVARTTPPADCLSVTLDVRGRSVLVQMPFADSDEMSNAHAYVVVVSNTAHGASVAVHTDSSPEMRTAEVATAELLPALDFTRVHVGRPGRPQDEYFDGRLALLRWYDFEVPRAMVPNLLQEIRS